MGTIKDLTSQKFGRLTVLSYAGQNNDHNAMWNCKCDCGNDFIARGSSLLKGATISCGCYRKEVSAKNHTKHGKSKSKLYVMWLGMCARCNNPNNENYSRYGGRGIKVCDEWRNYENFYNDMHSTYKKGLTIDRIDNDKGYSKDNCRWVTPQEQMHNYSRNVKITINGETDTVKRMCEKYNAKYDNVVRQIKKGKDPLEMLIKYKIKEL
jgi:hypothetical protein